MQTQEKICLIVDNSEEDRRRMRKIFAKSFPHMSMMVARDMGEARRRLRDRNVGFMFVENDLPDGQGIDLVAEMSRDPDLKEIPSVIVTDFVSPFIYAKARASNVRGVWTKKEFVEPKVRATVAATGMR